MILLTFTNLKLFKSSKHVFLILTAQGRREADCPVRGAKRPLVPHWPDEPRAAQLPVRLSPPSAFPLPVLHQAARAVHQGPHPAEGAQQAAAAGRQGPEAGPQGLDVQGRVAAARGEAAEED